MKNREKWAQEIIDIALSGETMGIKDGKPVYCSAIRCAECELHQFCTYGPGISTEQRVRAWAEAEAEDKETAADKLRREFVERQVWRGSEQSGASEYWGTHST